MGFVDSRGDMVVAPQFSGGFDFSEGVGVVVNAASGRMAVIDGSGREVFPAKYPRLFPRADGRHRYSPGLGIGFLDQRGEALPIKLTEDAKDFSENVASLRQFGESHVSIIDATGRIFARSHAPNLVIATEGVVPFCDGASELFGFLDLIGNVVVEPQFEFARSFSQGFAAVVMGDNRRRRAGFIDHGAKFLPISGATGCEPYTDGLAVFSAMVGRNQLCGAVNLRQEIVIPPAFALIGRFVEKLAPARLPKGKWGFVDSGGTWRIPPEFDDAEPFKFGLAEVTVKRERFYINYRGEIMWRETLE